MVSMTQLAHQLLSQKIGAGDFVVDATAGNGHDTLFLAQQTGATGRVWAIDLQAAAIEATQQRLFENGISDVTLITSSHEDLESLIPTEFHQHITGIMFNLGYLPGGNKELISNKATTLSALASSLKILKAGGILSVVAYPGHVGGDEEAKAVRDWFLEMQHLGHLLPEIPEAASERSPFLIVLIKSKIKMIDDERSGSC